MKKILLIEDNYDVRDMTAEILELENYQVATAENGKIGIEKARTFAPDLILCDIMMPEVDGYGVFEELSQDQKTACIPFIFLTAKSEKSDLRKGMAMGADDYLTKPFEAIDLIEAIEARLKKNSFLRKEFSRNVQGINDFIKEASKYQNLKDLSADRSLTRYRPKEAIFSEGSMAHNLYFIQSGEVKTYKHNENGKEYVTGMFSAGDFIGQLCILGSLGMYTETAVALSHCEICSIPKKDFTQLLFNNKEVSHKFIGMISNNVIHMQNQLMGLAFDSVRKRAATALLELYDKGLIKDDDMGISISREDFAGLIGTATETAIRVLSSFKDKGLIQLGESRRIILADKKQLQQVADFG
ncbi:cAMP-binding domain of CRP or a regulatory subunit of cAMP-dependent protein kinases [Zobellia uliginosa]|uniref:cAMP-binding domain of CRP or a regulatory subunit of cAMP-dependent protein kinases n=1 Tax=Zobellia uliginosa TaxID=143224 RepID=A0ABY1KNC9_9FLAO|nr:response regulator [Zobellia uliginosa]SIS52885.1 cAMP-binding domain of CRP or a regulatory subunit of cAMP-dependent protein kinases [Zobellia uliginosa]